jgi:hypothetical protein
MRWPLAGLFCSPHPGTIESGELSGAEFMSLDQGGGDTLNRRPMLADQAAGSSPQPGFRDLPGRKLKPWIAFPHVDPYEVAAVAACHAEKFKRGLSCCH